MTVHCISNFIHNHLKFLHFHKILLILFEKFSSKFLTVLTFLAARRWAPLVCWLTESKLSAQVTDSTHTVPKMDEFKKSPCGQISPCPGQTLRSNDIRMSFGLIIDLARSHLFRVKVMGFPGVRKWYKNVYKMANFQSRELIFCMKRYFWISSPPC